MHILSVTLGFYPATAWGGPVKIVHQNGRELVRRGHNVTVYCTNLLDKYNKIHDRTFSDEIDGMRVVYFDTWRLPWWPGTLGPIWLPELSDTLRNEIKHFDIIHVHGYRNLMNLPVAWIARKHNKPLVVQPHGAMPVIVNSLLIKKIYDRIIGWQELRDARAVIALQESERAQALERGVPSGRIEIIPNGLEQKNGFEKENGAKFRARFDIPATCKVILFLGRINKKKGTDMLVRAFARIGDIDARLVIAGPDDGQLAEVQALVKDHRLEDRVTFTGLLDEKEALQAYLAANLFVLPCRTDTFPTTIMEACQANLPMVITQGCESAHLVEGRVAEVVPFDVEKFAQAMHFLLIDDETYRQYQSNCAQVMQDTFSIQATVDRIETLYRNVRQEHGGKG